MSGNKYKILIIEDEENIRNFIKTVLVAHGYQVLCAKKGTEGEMLFESHCPDLVILDLGLPDMDGIQFIKKVREKSSVPILVLSARSNEKDKVEALDLGANDYVTKPFGTAELEARIRSALRNSGRGGEQDTVPQRRFSQGKMKIDYDARRIFVDEREVKLTQTEYNIVVFLSKQAGKVMTYAEIIQEIWGWNGPGSTKKLQVNMANIRKKIGERPGDAKFIHNELGVGYRMSVDESDD